MLFLTLFKESILFAFNALRVNKLRTLLSLLGITIGIFAIIMVFTIVDSFEKNLRDSIKSLGDNVVYVQKWPWSFEDNYPWWKYINRPVPKINELQEIQRRSQKAEAAALEVSASLTAKQGNNNIENASVDAVSHDYFKVTSFEIEKGRYFTDIESQSGRAVAIIGSMIAEGLFPNEDPVGKVIKIRGLRIVVIGVFKKQGESLLGNTTDTEILIPLNYMRNLVDIRNEHFDPFIMVKAKPGVSNDELIDELKGIMRSVRKVRPIEEDTFALNQTSLLSKGFDGLFDVVGIAGWIIGGFSILVGGFGIANIMFVSVKERTNLIGIQKALGAKNYFILLQFLVESVVLCLIGGIIGLLAIYGVTVLVSKAFDMEVALFNSNIILGVTISVLIGVLSGFVPAYTASQLDPVEAIRA